jgi:hypothetical protein
MRDLLRRPAVWRPCSYEIEAALSLHDVRRR